MVTSYPTAQLSEGFPGSSVHGILQARILEWVAISIPIKFYLLFVYSLNELMHLFIIILVLNI